MKRMTNMWMVANGNFTIWEKRINFIEISETNFKKFHKVSQSFKFREKFRQKFRHHPYLKFQNGQKAHEFSSEIS